MRLLNPPCMTYSSLLVAKSRLVCVVEGAIGIPDPMFCTRAESQIMQVVYHLWPLQVESGRNCRFQDRIYPNSGHMNKSAPTLGVVYFDVQRIRSSRSDYCSPMALQTVCIASFSMSAEMSKGGSWLRSSDLRLWGIKTVNTKYEAHCTTPWTLPNLPSDKGHQIVKPRYIKTTQYHLKASSRTYARPRRYIGVNQQSDATTSWTHHECAHERCS